MVSPFQGRPPTQQLLPPATRQPFDYWGGPFQQGGMPTALAPVEKTGVMGCYKNIYQLNYCKIQVVDPV